MRLLVGWISAVAAAQIFVAALAPHPVLAQSSELEGLASWAGPAVALDSIRLEGARFVADLEDGGMAQLTLSPSLQATVEAALAAHHVPFAAAAVISVPDGRVLALTGSSRVEPALDGAALAVQAWAPAASVFKVVSASALLQEAHLDPEARVCYHGGVSGLSPDNLLDLPALDRSCATLGYGVGKSQNAIIAKLASRNLSPEQLERMASAFGFGEAIDFDAPVETSELDIPREPLEFARAAAGFWHSSLSALHGALLAATIANRGEMPPPRLIARALDGQGNVLPLRKRPSRRVLDPAVAHEVGQMMRLTTTMGTARRSFRDRRGRPILPVEVAGKTGTLFYRGRANDPALPAGDATTAGRLGYSWFVGYAPVEKPTVAFAIVLGNPARSSLKAHLVARQVLAQYLVAEAPSQGHRRLLARR